LKPENLLLDTKGNLKIVDFGLSNIYSKGNLLKTACGSPCYAAPEMIAGKEYQGLKVDIWSIGVILFAMSCGYLPFEDKQTNNLYKKIMGGQFEYPNHISEKSKDLISNLLDINPLTRYNIE
jgi:5'-AMP-activated protein kinase, catalytic alpha subunit